MNKKNPNSKVLHSVSLGDESEQQWAMEPALAYGKEKLLDHTCHPTREGDFQK